MSISSTSSVAEIKQGRKRGSIFRRENEIKAVKVKWGQAKRTRRKWIVWPCSQLQPGPSAHVIWIDSKRVNSQFQLEIRNNLGPHDEVTSKWILPERWESGQKQEMKEVVVSNQIKESRRINKKFGNRELTTTEWKLVMRKEEKDYRWRSFKVLSQSRPIQDIPRRKSNWVAHELVGEGVQELSRRGHLNCLSKP